MLVGFTTVSTSSTSRKWTRLAGHVDLAVISTDLWPQGQTAFSLHTTAYEELLCIRRYMYAGPIGSLSLLCAGAVWNQLPRGS